MFKRHIYQVAIIATVSLTAFAALSGCSSKNVAATSTSNNPGDYRACVVAAHDVERAENGLEKAKKEFGITTDFRTVGKTNDPERLLNQLAKDRCNVIIGVGQSLITPIKQTAPLHHDISFAVMGRIQMADDFPPNVRPISWDPYQPAYMAGYLAGGTSATGKIYAFADHETPEKRQLMSAFAQGVEAYNTDVKQKQKELPLAQVNIDIKTGKAVFIGDNPPREEIQKQVSQAVEEEASVIFAPLSTNIDLLVSEVGHIEGLTLDHRGKPVTTDSPSSKRSNPVRDDSHALSTVTLIAWEPMGHDIFAQLVNASEPVKILNDPDKVWGTTTTDTTMIPPILTSIMLNTEYILVRTIEDARNSALTNDAWIANIENGGAALAPFHTFDSTIPSAVKNQISTLIAEFNAQTRHIDLIVKQE